MMFPSTTAIRTFFSQCFTGNLESFATNKLLRCMQGTISTVATIYLEDKRKGAKLALIPIEPSTWQRYRFFTSTTFLISAAKR